MLREGPGRPAGDPAGDPVTEPVAATTGEAETGPVPATGAAPPRPRRVGLAALIRGNLLFTVALVAAAVPRVIVMLGYQPAILFKLDTFDYLWDAAHLKPNPVNPSGYTVFLWLLKPLHSLAFIAGLQHLLGLVAAVLVYAVLRRFGVRPWVSTLAVLPLLFDPAQFLLEQLIMADLLAMVLMIAAFAVLLLADRPSVLRGAIAGLLMGASATVRPTTLPLIVFLAVYLLVRRSGWRQAVAVLLAGALPLVAYLAWFSAVFGSFNLTNSNGLFLWSRTMSFANCATIKPPADLVALCPDQQPGAPATGRLLPKLYLWDHAAWMWKNAAPSGIVPDTAAFTAANNKRAQDFAIRAIEAQPLGYLHAVAKDVATPFTSKDTFPFPVTQERPAGLGPANRRYADAAVQAYVGSTAGITPYLGHHLGSHLVDPWARLIRGYQRVIFMPGPLFAVIVAGGLVGFLLPRRRTGAAILLWVSAAVTVILPIAEHEYTYRYVIPAVPLACMAAALAFARTGRAPEAAPAVVAGPAAEPSPGDGAEALS
jgi:hypothetical protein